MMRPASLPKDAGRRRARRPRRPHPRPCRLRRPRWRRLRCPRRPRRRPSPRRLCFGRRRRHRRQLRPRPLHSRLAAASPRPCNWQHEDRSARVELLEAALAAKRHAAQEAAVARCALPEQNTNAPIFGSSIRPHVEQEARRAERRSIGRRPEVLQGFGLGARDEIGHAREVGRRRPQQRGERLREYRDPLTHEHRPMKRNERAIGSGWPASETRWRPIAKMEGRRDLSCKCDSSEGLD